MSEYVLCAFTDVKWNQCVYVCTMCLFVKKSVSDYITMQYHSFIHYADNNHLRTYVCTCTMYIIIIYAYMHEIPMNSHESDRIQSMKYAHTMRALAIVADDIWTSFILTSPKLFNWMAQAIDLQVNSGESSFEDYYKVIIGLRIYISRSEAIDEVISFFRMEHFFRHRVSQSEVFPSETWRFRLKRLKKVLPGRQS